MITTWEIQNKEFSKSIRGYNMDEVDDFLDEIIASYEKMHLENIELKDKITILNDKLETYKDLENTLKDTLIMAQTTADETVKNAKNKADMIIKESEFKGKKELEEIESKIQLLELEYNDIKREFSNFRHRYISFLESQKQTVNKFYDEISVETEEE